MSRPFKTAAVITLLSILAGCVSLGGGKAPPTLFTLSATSTAPTGALASGKAGDAIVVADPDTDRRLAVLRVPVQIDAANVAYLQNAAWVERPSRLFGALLAETLRARGGRLVFAEAEAPGVGLLRLSGRLIDMGYDARSMAVVVRFDAMKQGPLGAIATQRFESTVPGVAAKPEQIGPALNKAANDVARQVADWVG